ncbi:MAG: hypothetical protein ACRCR2_02620 [Fusobacteriaceae bacterium]
MKFPLDIVKRAEIIIERYNRKEIHAKTLHGKKYKSLAVGKHYRLLNRGKEWELMSHSDYNRRIDRH